MKYKVGDKVRVKPLEEFKKACKDLCIYIEDVKHLAGQVVTINVVSEIGEYYNIVEDIREYCWDDTCFEGRVDNYLEMLAAVSVKEGKKDV